MWRFRLLACVAALAGCGPVPVYYKQGVAVARLDQDRNACAVSALRDAPVASQIRQRPPIYVPGARRCDASGNCYVYPGYWVDGGIYTVDVNASLRAQLESSCMAGRGYAQVSLPRCTGSVTLATGGVLPPLSQESCALPPRGGTPARIVTPGQAISME